MQYQLRQHDRANGRFEFLCSCCGFSAPLCRCRRRGTHWTGRCGSHDSGLSTVRNCWDSGHCGCCALLRLVLWCDNICGCFAWKMQYLGNQRGIFAPNIFLSPGKMFIGCRDIQFFARSQGFPFFHRISPSRDLLPLFLTTIHNDSHRSMVNLSSIVVIK